MYSGPKKPEQLDYMSMYSSHVACICLISTQDGVYDCTHMNVCEWSHMWKGSTVIKYPFHKKYACIAHESKEKY